MSETTPPQDNTGAAQATPEATATEAPQDLAAQLAELQAKNAVGKTAFCGIEVRRDHKKLPSFFRRRHTAQ